MTTCLRTPYPNLSADNFIARGSAGQVFGISRSVVFKCRTNFDYPGSQQKQEIRESAEKIAREQAIYELLMQHRHPNIVRCVRIVPEGIFLERMPQTLELRLAESASVAQQTRWIYQITTALSWIEKLGYVHGDLRPNNILLSSQDDACLADFDASVLIGNELLTASEPFCRLNPNCEPFTAGPLTEQFALASCIYNIRFGHLPHHYLDPPTRVQKFIKNEFPSTNEDKVFGDIITRGWLGQYGTIASVVQAVQFVSALSDLEMCYGAKEIDGIEQMLLDCEVFLDAAGTLS